MASKDGEFSVSHNATFFLQLAYLATGAIMIFASQPNPVAVFGTYLGIIPMALGLVVCVIFSWFFLGAMAATDLDGERLY